MFKLNRFALILGLAGVMADAVRYEKAKHAAADRQARIEEGRERPANTADRIAVEPGHRDKDKSAKPAATARRTPPPHPGNPQ
jgi:hypothetical protein